MSNTQKVIEVLLGRVSFAMGRGTDYIFEVENRQGVYLLSAWYMDVDINTGELEKQRTRKWHVSEFATKSEIVQTAFKCVLTSMEHRTREAFLYDGLRIYGPHLPIDSLCDLVSTSEEDQRPVPNRS